MPFANSGSLHNYTRETTWDEEMLLRQEGQTLARYLSADRAALLPVQEDVEQRPPQAAADVLTAGAESLAAAGNRGQRGAEAHAGEPHLTPGRGDADVSGEEERLFQKKKKKRKLMHLWGVNVQKHTHKKNTSEFPEVGCLTFEYDIIKYEPPSIQTCDGSDSDYSAGGPQSELRGNLI